MRMLAINFGGLGDEVLFLPTLKSIKAEHPEWHITLLTEPRAKSITQLTNLIDDNVVFDIKKRPLLPADYINLISLLRSGSYDIVLSSGGSTQVSMLLFLSGIKRRVGYDSGAIGRMLLTDPVSLNREQYAGNMYHDLVKGLGIKATAAPPEVILQPDSLARMRAFLDDAIGNSVRTASGANQSRAQVVIHPGTSRLAILKGIIKVWSAQNWCQLILQLQNAGHDVILAGGPEDTEAVEQILRGVESLANMLQPQSGRFISAIGKTANVADLAALIHLCSLMICVDSAPMHISAGVGQRTVALFGPTDPEKLLPKSPAFIAIKENRSASDPAGSRDGILISVDTVFEHANQLLQSRLSKSTLD